MKIQISIKGLAKYMSARESARRSILHDFKYRDDEKSVAQVHYYKEARQRITAYHRFSRLVDWLLDESVVIQLEADSCNGQRQARLKKNVLV
ncbi:MAG: hypothetical protein ABIK83_15820 [Candidatus Zixiibacteriota bacterium]